MYDFYTFIAHKKILHGVRLRSDFTNFPLIINKLNLIAYLEEAIRYVKAKFQI